MSATPSANKREALTRTRRMVIKIGSAILTKNNAGLDSGGIAAWVEQIATLRKREVDVVLVTSGAVAAGMQRLNQKTRPQALHELQAMAAIGQMGLIQAYESAFQQHGLRTAQVLLTHEDLTNRQRYLNARSTLRTLLRLRAIPVVNENDTVAIEEIRLGDNDTLAGLVVNLVEADLLVILTDQGGFYDRDPRLHTDAALIAEAHVNDPRLVSAAGGSGMLGRGGMRTKLTAAEKAARSGAATVIASGWEEKALLRIVDGDAVGTYLKPVQGRLAARKQWLAGQLQVRGRLTLDEGAVKVICSSGKSLLPVGVKAVDGKFVRGEMVACLDTDGREVARGLVNYNAEESARIVGRPSHEIQSILGYVDEPELIHRDNMILVGGPK